MLRTTSTAAAPGLLEKGRQIEVMVDVVKGRGSSAGSVLPSWAEAEILSVVGSPPNRAVCVSYAAWRPDLDIPLVRECPTGPI